jgi:hypothetical protein
LATPKRSVILTNGPGSLSSDMREISPTLSHLA